MKLLTVAAYRIVQEAAGTEPTPRIKITTAQTTMRIRSPDRARAAAQEITQIIKLEAEAAVRDSKDNQPDIKSTN